METKRKMLRFGLINRFLVYTKLNKLAFLDFCPEMPFEKRPIPDLFNSHNLIGRGEMGSVYRIKSKSGIFCAIKEFSNNFERSKELRKALEKLILTLR